LRLLPTVSISFGTTSIRLLSLLLITKYVASIGGPTAIALLGQFQNLQQLMISLTTFGSSQGVTKLISENRTSGFEEIFSTARTLIFVASFIIGLIFLIFHSDITLKIFSKDNYEIIIIVLGLLIFFNAANTLLIASLNGVMNTKLWSLVNLNQIICTLICVLLGGTLLGLKGIFLGFPISHFLSFFLNYLLIKNRHETIQWIPIFKINVEVLKRLVAFSGFTFISMLIVPWSLTVVRSHIITNLGDLSAGYWQSILFICTTFQMLITTTMSVYFLPKVSSSSSNFEILLEIKRIFRLALLIVFIGAGLVYLSREFLITIIFDERFLPSADYLLFQLLGTMLRVLAWIYSYALLATGRLQILIFLELVFTTLFVVLSINLINSSGIMGATHAYLLINGAYLITVYSLCRKIFAK